MKKPIRRIALFAVLPFAAIGAARAQNLSSDLAPVEVIASRTELQDIDAPFAAEVYTRDDIRKSGASSLFDFLQKFTSLQVSPSFGNQATPSIDLRGYGAQFGSENLAIVVDGRRLNTVDLSSPFLGSVQLQDIERIELALGSGSVIYGDGAVSGVLNIVTKARDGAVLGAYVGNYGVAGATFQAGQVRDRYHLNVSGATDQNGGTGERDAAGNNNASGLNNWRFDGGWNFENRATLDLVTAHAQSSVWYPGWLTLSQWQADPAQASTNSNNPGYANQSLTSDSIGLRASLPLNPEFTLKSQVNSQAKQQNSAYPLTPSNNYSSAYLTNDGELDLVYSRPGYQLSTGLQARDANRTQPGSTYTLANVTSKNNTSAFAQATHTLDRYTISYGYRVEAVNYAYNPSGSGSLGQTLSLGSWELGLNYRYNDSTNLFTNYNHASRAPDIDMFFTFNPNGVGQVFNGFIGPMTTDTITLGVNSLTKSSKLRADVFYTKLQNEIYYDPINYINTNLARTHKFGLELHDDAAMTDRLSAWLNYSYTVAIVDADNTTANGTLNGTTVPGVPRNSVRAGLKYQVTPLTTASLSTVWRDAAYNWNDITNTGVQLQAPYQSTDLMFNQVFNAKLDGYLGVTNVFNQSNGVFTQTNVIYPYDYARMVKIGLRWAL